MSPRVCGDSSSALFLDADSFFSFFFPPMGVLRCGYQRAGGHAAVMASDYSIAQFRFLSRLLLVHGRWDYQVGISRTGWWVSSWATQVCSYFPAACGHFNSLLVLQEHHLRVYSVLVCLLLRILGRGGYPSPSYGVCALCRPCSLLLQTIHDSWHISFFNLVFTSMPIVLHAIFDQDVSAEAALMYPKLYGPGQRKERVGGFLGWVWCAV